MQEIWKEIPNTDGLYFASSKGQIKSSDRTRYYVARHKAGYYVRKGKILKQVINSHGYPCVTLKYLDGIQKVITVHRLVAITFLKQPSIESNQVNHIDGNKTNNCINNLEWCTARENILHAYATGLNKGSKPMLGKTSGKSPRAKSIYKCDLQGNILKMYVCITDAAKELNIAPSHISSCARGYRKTCAGYTWKYVN